MKILHVGLLSHFTEGMTYQDNILANIHCQDGHEVLFISDNFTYVGGKLVEVPEQDILLDNSLRLIRVKYDKILNEFVTRKIQRVRTVKEIIEDFCPNVILYHGVCGAELMTVGDYKKNHPKMKLYVDCHSDFHNTAKIPISKLAYKYIHGFFFKRALPYIDKVFYVTNESKKYLRNMYRLNEDIMEWYPLGGIVFDDKTYQEKREKRRKELKLKDTDILFLHTGKKKKKKKTLTLLNSFVQMQDNHFKLIIIGEFLENIWDEVRSYLCIDQRISFLGWKKGEELMEYLCAGDIYLQPGSQSATLQNAICCRCGVIVYPYSSYQPLVKGNGFYVKNEKEIIEVFNKIHNYPQLVNKMKKESAAIGREILDYRKIAARIYY